MLGVLLGDLLFLVLEAVEGCLQFRNLMDVLLLFVLELRTELEDKLQISLVFVPGLLVGEGLPLVVPHTSPQILYLIGHLLVFLGREGLHLHQHVLLVFQLHLFLL